MPAGCWKIKRQLWQMLLGYSDYKNFTQSFKEAFGMSPGEYQKQIKEKKEESTHPS